MTRSLASPLGWGSPGHLTVDLCSPQVPAQPAGRGDGALGGAEAGDGLPAQEADGARGAALGQGAGAGQVGRAWSPAVGGGGAMLMGSIYCLK